MTAWKKKSAQNVYLVALLHFMLYEEVCNMRCLASKSFLFGTSQILQR